MLIATTLVKFHVIHPFESVLYHNNMVNIFVIIKEEFTLDKLNCFTRIFVLSHDYHDELSLLMHRTILKRLTPGDFNIIEENYIFSIAHMLALRWQQYSNISHPLPFIYSCSLLTVANGQKSTYTCHKAVG